jgi:hypothetical protein
MEIILSKNCQSLTGTISRSHGYSVRRTGERFFGIRSTRGFVPPDGHWRFILSIAHLAPANIIVADISIRGTEIMDALYEANHPFAAIHMVEPEDVYSATDVLKLEKQLTEFSSDKNHEC